MTQNAGQIFETMVRTLVATNSTIAHEWQPIQSNLAGARLDIVFADGVWAAIRPDQIAVGAGQGHEDFEAFGKFSGRQVADNAFTYLLELLRNRGMDAR